MNKSTRIVKKLLILFLVVLMSIESFCAVVTENDGSAFITKQELEKVKKDLDVGIDAIEIAEENILNWKVSDYVNGLRLNGRPRSYFEQIKTLIGENPRWLNRGFNLGSTSLNSTVITVRNKNYSTRWMSGSSQYVPGTFHYYRYGGQNGQPNALIFVSSKDVSAIDNGVLVMPDKQVSDSGYGEWVDIYGKQGDQYEVFQISNLEWYQVLNRQDLNYPSYDHLWTLHDAGKETIKTYWPSSDAGWTKVTCGGSAVKFQDESNERVTIVCVAGLRKDGWLHRNPEFMQGTRNTSSLYFRWYRFPQDMQSFMKNADHGGSVSTTNVSISQTNTINNPLTLWKYRKISDTEKVVDSFQNTCYLNQNLITNYKSYIDHNAIHADNMVDNDLSDTTTATYSPNNSATYGRTTYGSNKTGYSTETGIGYLEQIITWVEATTDTIDYSKVQFGNGTTSSIYCLENQPTLTRAGLLNHSVTDFAQAANVTIGPKKHTISKVTNNIYGVTATPETYNMNSFQNEYYSNVAGEKVYLGYGMPILKTNVASGVETTYNVTLTVKLTDKLGASKGENVNLKLSRNHFVDGNFGDATNDKVYEATITTNSSGVGQATFSFDGVKMNQLLWINFYGLTDNRIVELTDFKISIA